MCLCHMSVSGSSRPFLLSEENIPSLLWDPMPSQVPLLTHCGGRRFTAQPCLWAALGVAAGHHVVQHLSTTQLEKAQPWPLHFSDSSAACTKPLCVLKHHADQCSTGKGIKCDCPSRGLSFQRPHHPRWPLLWVTHATGWRSPQLKLYQLWAWWFTGDRKWVQSLSILG